MNEQTKEWSRKILNVASERIDAELDRMGIKFHIFLTTENIQT